MALRTPKIRGGSNYSEHLFAGFQGLNNKYSNEQIADTESPDLLNVEFDALGAIVKRKGYALSKNFGTAQINSIFPFYTDAGVRKLIVTYGTSIVQYDPVSGATTNVTTTLNGNGQRFSSALDVVHDKVYMVNGNTTDGLMSWDGTTFASGIAGAPKAEYLLFYKNRMYAAGDSSAPNRLYMSDLGDPESWPALNFIDIQDGLGSITGLAQLGDSLIVFKEHGVFILKGSGPSDYLLVTTFSGAHGAVNHWTIVNLPNGLMYLSRDGVYEFNGREFTLKSDKIQGSIDDWNQSYLDQAVAFEYDHKYWLSVPEGVGQTTNNRTYLYHYLYKWWTRYDLKMQACGQIQGSTQDPMPYFTDTVGNLFQAESGDSDNGSAIRSYFVTKNYDFGNSAHYKSFKRIAFDALAQAGNYSLTLTFTQDFGNNTKSIQMPLSSASPTIWGQFTWGTAKWGGQSQVAHMSTALPGQAKYIQFRIDQNGADTPFTLLRWLVKYKMKARIV